MTLEEAIKHCEEIAELKYDQGNEARLQEQDKYADECIACAAEHRQLAEWLKELKERRTKDVPDTNVGDMVSRQAAIRIAEQGQIHGFPWQFEQLTKLSSAQPEQSIPISWIEKQIDWLKSMDNEFSSISAINISVLVKKWRKENGKDDGSD